MTELARWVNFFVIVGSSAGALIGLQFVVMALVADMPRTPNQAQAGHVFATPNSVHFSTVLLLSAALSAPWHGIRGPSFVWGLIGLCGLVYAAIVTRRLRRQTVYQPVFEDWLFHALLPAAAYATLAASAWEARAYAHQAMFGVAEGRCCYYSSAFTTPGTQPPATSSSINRSEKGRKAPLIRQRRWKHLNACWPAVHTSKCIL